MVATTQEWGVLDGLLSRDWIWKRTIFLESLRVFHGFSTPKNMQNPKKRKFAPRNKIQAPKWEMFLIGVQTWTKMGYYCADWGFLALCETPSSFLNKSLPSSFCQIFLSRFGYQSESVLQLYQLPQFQPEQELLPQSIQRLEAQSLFNIKWEKHLGNEDFFVHFGNDGSLRLSEIDLVLVRLFANGIPSANRCMSNPRVHVSCCVVPLCGKLRWKTSTRQGLFGATPPIQRFVGRTGAKTTFDERIVFTHLGMILYNHQVALFYRCWGVHFFPGFSCDFQECNPIGVIKPICNNGKPAQCNHRFHWFRHMFGNFELLRLWSC